MGAVALAKPAVVTPYNRRALKRANSRPRALLHTPRRAGAILAETEEPTRVAISPSARGEGRGQPLLPASKVDASRYTTMATELVDDGGMVARFLRPERYLYFVENAANTRNRGLRKDACHRPDRHALWRGVRGGPDGGADRPGSGLAAETQAGDPGLRTRSGRPGLVRGSDRALQLRPDLLQFLRRAGAALRRSGVLRHGPGDRLRGRSEIIHCFTPCSGEYMLPGPVSISQRQGVLPGFPADGQSDDRDVRPRETAPRTSTRCGVRRAARAGARECDRPRHRAELRHVAPTTPTATRAWFRGGFTWRETYWVRGKKDTRPLSLTGFQRAAVRGLAVEHPGQRRLWPGASVVHTRRRDRPAAPRRGRWRSRSRR